MTSSILKRARSLRQLLCEHNNTTWDEIDRETVFTMDALIADNERLFNRAQIFAAERDNARACYDNAVRLLIEIHSMMYPPQVKLPDGRTMAFRPTNPDPHAVLQELSDRIRDLPDRLRDIDALNMNKPTQ